MRCVHILINRYAAIGARLKLIKVERRQKVEESDDIGAKI